MTEIGLFQGVSPCFSLSNCIDKRFDISDLSYRTDKSLDKKNYNVRSKRFRPLIGCRRSLVCDTAKQFLSALFCTMFNVFGMKSLPLNSKHLCYSTITCKVFIESSSTLLNQPQHKLGQLAQIVRYVQIKTFDNQPPVLYLAIRQRSDDL